MSSSTGPPEWMEAMMAQMKRLLKEEMDQVHERLSEIEQNENGDGNGNGNWRRDHEQEPRMENLKVNIPSFKGTNDPEAYLNWEIKIEHAFSCNNYSDDQKIKLAVAEFSDYAVVWWDKFKRDRRRYEEPMVETWVEFKRIMRRRYIPASYLRDIKMQLQRMKQGARSVEEYYKDLEVTMLRGNVDEDDEATMARFLNGLNSEIRDKVELLPYINMEDLLHKARQVEQQAKRRFSSPNSKRRSTSPNSFAKKNNWQGQSSKTSPSISPNRSQGKNSINPSESKTKTKARDMQCYKCLGKGHYAYECPTRRVVVIRENGEYSSESEPEETPTKQTNKKGSPEVEEIVIESEAGSFLMVRRVLGAQETPLGPSQRDTIFQARCNVKGRLCSLIIDSGSCTNVASTTLVTRLNLETKPHPQPYKLQWLSNDGKLTVSEQVEVDITMGQYKDKVLCDVVPMEASHLLLGRPWQFDKKATHDGFTNQFSFVQDGKKYILKPLTPKEVSEDRVRMREVRLGEWSDKRSKDGKEKQIQKSVEGETHSKNDEGETHIKNNYFVRKNFLLRKSFDFCKENLFENSIANVFPSNQILQELRDVCSKEAPHEMSKLNKIEDLVAKAAIIIEPTSKPKLNGKDFDVSYFNMTNMPSLNVGDEPLNLRANSFQEGGYDEDIKGQQKDGPNPRIKFKNSKGMSKQLGAVWTKLKGYNLNLEDTTIAKRDKKASQRRRKQNWKEPYKLRALPYNLRALPYNLRAKKLEGLIQSCPSAFSIKNQDTKHDHIHPKRIRP